MRPLREAIQEAEDKHVAIGHFNISDALALDAIVDAARELSVPVIIGVSEGERGFLGTKRTADLVNSIREEYDYPIYLNSDHTHTFEGIKEVVDAGFDAAVFDPVAKARKEGRPFSIEEHIAITKEVVAYAKEKNSDFLIEGELGYIGSSSSMHDEMPEGADVTEDNITKVEEAKRFVDETGIDLLAPSVGNVHGMFKHARNPRLFIDRIRDIRQGAGVPLVLHGGSGISDEDFVAAIDAGVAIVHINTELRVAWRKGLERSLSKDIEQIAPYKLLLDAKQGVHDATARRLRLFNRM
jgi:fructose-bisphosphate aldolase class II